PPPPAPSPRPHSPPPFAAPGQRPTREPCRPHHAHHHLKPRRPRARARRPQPHPRLFFKTTPSCGAVDPAPTLVPHSPRRAEKLSAGHNPGPAAAIASGSCQLWLREVKIGRRQSPNSRI